MKTILTPNNHRFLPSFITLVTAYRIPSYASNENCDETGDGKLDTGGPKKCLYVKISLQINMTMKATTFSAVLLIFTRRPAFIPALKILPETKLPTFVKYLLPQITRRYSVKIYYKICGIYFTFPTKEAKHRSYAAAP